MKRKLLTILLCATLVVGTMAGCGSDKKSKDNDNATEQQEKVFVMPTSFMPTTFQPTRATVSDQILRSPFYDYLIGLGADGLEYYLAESLEMSEDAKKYTLKLRDNATWSDGEPITTDDILFTLEYQKTLGGGAVNYYADINGEPIQYNKVDDKTLEIVLPTSDNGFDAKLVMLGILPSHAFSGDITKVDNSGYFNSPSMVTSGAYKVAEINEDNIVGVARDDYYLGRPEVDKVIIKLVGEGNAEQLAFDEGEISYMHLNSAEEIEKYSDSEKYNLYNIPNGEVKYISINPYSELSDDARKAICLALNNQEIIDATFGSDMLAIPANSMMTPEQTYYNPDCKGYVQNVEEAKKLAESSGLTDRTLRFMINADHTDTEKIATVVQQQLAAIGVKVEIMALESTNFYDRTMAAIYGNGLEKDFDMYVIGLNDERGDSLCQLGSMATSLIALTGYSEEIQNLAIAAGLTADPEELKKIDYEFQDKILEDYKTIPLFYTNTVLVSQKNITGLDASTAIPEIRNWPAIKIK